ncbi:uncharacterized protein LOC142177017 [Nicotiana tabacum]|uniref:Uncharacterized protein LOC142177017 n=1 Tax=Nicotiana tabacum TaxID=4097 RepID=A0AC58TWG2_TOBAC
MTGTYFAPTLSLSGSTSQVVNHDVNHSYFLHSSDALGMTLVTSPFDERGFSSWRRSILIALSAKNKLGFINGVCDGPTLGSKDHAQWSRCNDMVTSWLLNSLTKEIGDNVIYSKSAKELWNSLEHMLWDELDSLNSHLGCTCTCMCEGKKKVAKFLEDQRVIQFLMGLNNVYAHARGNILLMIPLPIMDHAYSFLLHDESQREIYVSPQYPSDGTFFMVGTPGKFNHRKNNHKTWGTPQKQGNNKNIQQKFKKKTKYNPNVSRTHRMRTWHIRADCYKLIGFPNDFQFTRLTNYQPPIKENAVMEGQENKEKTNACIEGNMSNHNQFFSKEQVSELVNIIKKIIDSGACFDASSFINFTSLPVPLNISLPNSFQLCVTYIGSVSIQPDMVLHRVLHVPSFNLEIISMYGRQKFNLKVKKIISDNAIELGTRSQEASFLDSQGIIHETSCVATPQQNGAIERKHRHLFEVAKALFFHSKVLKGLTAYEVLLGKQPNYDSLKIFGYLWYASTLSHNKGKFEPRAKGCVSRICLESERIQSLFLEMSGTFPHAPTESSSSPISPSFFPTLSTTQLSSSSPSNTSKCPTSHTPTNITLTPSKSTHVSYPSYSFTRIFSPSSITTRTPIPVHPPPVRKFDRVSQKPPYLDDYICNNIFLSNLSSCLSKPLNPTASSFGALSMNNQHLLTSISSISEPTNYLQASTHHG